MTIQSSFRHFLPRQQNTQQPTRDPQKVILEMGEYIKVLRSKLDEIAMIAHYDCLTGETHAPCNKDIIQLVFDSIAMEKDAEHELAFTAMSMFQDNVDTNFEMNARDFANALVSFGTHLLRELKRYQLYKNGFLPYQFQGWIDNDLVLSMEKHDIDTLNARMYISRYDPDPGV